MKTLYVSDLDGTLLRNDQKTSEYTNQIINKLVRKGVLFSYASARSFLTAKKVTAGISAQIPMIAYNGAMVVDCTDGTVILNNFFDDGIYGLLDDLINCGVYPIVYSVNHNKEKMTFVMEKATSGMCQFLDSRKNDERRNPVSSEKALYSDGIFYVTCIDTEEKLEPLYKKYQDKYHCVYHIDIYTKTPWLEIMPRNASKANAIKQLKDHYDCDKVVVFGDGKNDIDMFIVADEAYAVENAVPELKEIATGIIGSNENDGVAKYLEKVLDL